MASRTIREYAVTLKADAKDALKSLDTFRTVVNATQTSVTNAFSTMASSTQKSVDELNTAINKLIKAQAKLSGDKASKATDNMKEVLKDQKLSAEEQVKLKQETVDKLIDEEKRLNEIIEKLIKQRTDSTEKKITKAQKDLAKVTERFKIPIGELEKDDLIEDMRGLGVALKDQNKVNNQRLLQQLRKMSGNQIIEIKDGAEKIEKILLEAQKEQLSDLKKAQDKVLQTTAATGAERTKLLEKFAKQRVKIEKETGQKIAATQRTAGNRVEESKNEVQTGRIGAGGKLFGKLKGKLGGMGEVGQGAADQVPGLGKLSGGLQKVLGKAGPYGKAAGAIVGATVAIGAVMVKAAAKADLFNRAAKGLENATGFTGDKLAGLKDQLLQIPRPASQSAEDIAKLAGNVAKFEKPENIVEVTKSITELARLEPDIDVGKLSAGVGRLGKAFGSTQLAMDLMAATAKELKGKAQDPLDEATTELGVVFSKATLAIGDTSRAAKESAAVFTVLTETGFEVSEATTAAEEIFLKLNDAVTDPKLAKALQKDLPEGMKLADIGIDGVNSSAVKMIQFMQSGGDAAKKIATTLGATAGEALSILQSQFQKTGLNIDDFTKKFDDIEGAAGNIAASLTTPMQAANEKLKTSFDRLFIGVGQSFAGSTFGVDILADAMAGLADFMLPIGVQLDSQKAKLAEVNGELSTLDGLSANIGDQIEEGLNIDPEVATAALKQVVDNIGIIEKQSPVVAAQIKAIGDSKLSINEKLIQTQNLLKGIQNIAEGMAIVESFETQTLALEKFNETLNDSSSIWSTLANVGDTILDIGLIGAVLPDFSDMIDADQFLGIDKSVTTMKEKFAGIQEELTTLNPKTDDWKTKMEEAREVSKELTELQKTQTSLNSGFESQIQDVLTAKLGEKGVTAETLDLELLKSQIVAGQGNEALRESAEFNEKVRIELEKQLGLTDEAGNAAVLKAQSAADEVAATSNLMSIKTQLASTDDATKEAALSRLESLFTEGAITDELLNKKASEAGLTNELNAVKLESLNADMSALEAKKLINGTLDEADAKELAMLEKKMQSTEADLAKTQSAEAILATQEQILVATIAGIEANQAGSQMLSEEQAAELEILNTKLEKVNAEQLSIELKEQAAELSFVEADASEAVNLMIEEKLDFEEASNDEKMAAIDLLKEENATQVQLLENEITGLKATIAAEDAKQAVLEEQRKIKNDLLRQEGLEPIAIKKSTNAAKEKLKEMEAQLAILKAAGKALDTAGTKVSKKSALDKGLGTSKLKAKREARKAEREAEKSAKKEATKAAKKDRGTDGKKSIKKKKDDQKSLEKIEEERRAQMKKDIEEASKLADQFSDQQSKIHDFQAKITESLKRDFAAEQKLRETRLNAEQKFIDNITAFRNKLRAQSDQFRDTAFKNIESIVAPFRTISQRIGDSMDDIVDKSKEFNDVREKTLHDNLIKLDKSAAEERKIRDTANTNVLQATADLGKGVRIFRNITLAREKKKGIKQPADETKKSLKELKLAVDFTSGALRHEAGKLGALKDSSRRAASRLRNPLVGPITKANDRKLQKANKEEFEQIKKRTSDLKSSRSKLLGVYNKLKNDAETLAGAQKTLVKEINISRVVLEKGTALSAKAIKKIAAETALEQKKISTDSSITAEEQAGILTASETKSIKQLEALGVGFSAITKELKEISDIQKSARLSEDADKASELYNEARNKLFLLNRELVSGNQTVEDLTKQYDIVFEKLTAISDKLTEEQKIHLNSLGIVRDTAKETDERIESEHELKQIFIDQKKAKEDAASIGETTQKATELVSTVEVVETDEVKKINTAIAETRKGLADDIAALKTGLLLIVLEREGLRKELEDLKKKNKAAEEIGDESTQKKLSEDIRETEKRLFDANKEALKLADSLGKGETAAKDLEKAVPDLNEKAKTEKLSRNLGDLAPDLDKRSSDIFGLLDNFSDKASAIGDAFELGEEGSEAALKSIGGLIQDTATQMAGLLDAGSQAAQDVIKIGDMFGSGDTVEAVGATADLTAKVGKALLNAPGPLAIAGAVLLGVGLISKAVVSIIKLVSGSEKTALDVAEERKREQEKIQGVYAAQIGSIETLQELESNLTDTARERLDILTKEHDLLLDNSSEARVNARLTDEQLADQKTANEAEQKRLKSIIAQGEAVKDQDKAARAEFLGDESDVDFGFFASESEVEAFVGRIKAQLVNLETDAAGLDLELDFRSMSLEEIAAVVDELTSILDAKTEIFIEFGDIDAATSKIQQGIDIIAASVQDELSEVGLDFRDVAGASTEELQKMFIMLQNSDVSPKILDTFETLIGMSKKQDDLLNGSNESRKEEIDSAQELLNVQKELGVITQDKFELKSIKLLNMRLDLLNEITASEQEILEVKLELLDFQQSENQANIDLIRLKEQLGVISGDAADAEILGILQDELELVNEIGVSEQRKAEVKNKLLEFQRTEADNEMALIDAKEKVGKLTAAEAKEQKLEILENELATLNEIGASELVILEIEGEILDLKESQNEQDMEAERLLTDKVRNLQKVLDLARAESGGGTPTAQGKEQITQAREDIVTELKAQGRSDEFINEFLASLPKFKEGGFNPGFGLAEPGEFVFKAPTVAAIGKDVLNMINKNPFALGNMQSDKIVADTFLKKEAAILTQNNNTDIFLNMNVQTSPGQSATQIGNAIGTSVELKLVPTINKLFQQNKINSSLGGAQ